MKKIYLLAPLVFLLLAPAVLAKDNFWKGPDGPHGRGGCENASWHTMKDDDHHLVYPDCIEIEDEDGEESPEPSGSPEASATPSGSPVASPTATPSVSPSGTPSGSPEATATPSETPTESPSGSPLSIESQETGTGLQGLIQELLDLLKDLIGIED